MFVFKESNTIKTEVPATQAVVAETSTTTKRSAYDLVTKAAAAVATPLTALSVAFERIGRAIFFSAMQMLEQGARLLGLEKILKLSKANVPAKGHERPAALQPQPKSNRDVAVDRARQAMGEAVEKAKTAMGVALDKTKPMMGAAIDRAKSTLRVALDRTRTWSVAARDKAAEAYKSHPDEVEAARKLAVVATVGALVFMALRTGLNAFGNQNTHSHQQQHSTRKSESGDNRTLSEAESACDDGLLQQYLSVIPARNKTSYVDVAPECMPDDLRDRYAGECFNGKPHGEGTIYRDIENICRIEQAGTFAVGKLVDGDQYRDDASYGGIYLYRGRFENETLVSGKRYHRNGDLEAEGTFENDELVQGRKFGANGRLWADGTFENGKLINGKKYRGDGKLDADGTFENGKIVEGKLYHWNGNVASDGIYKDGLLAEGATYHSDGSLKYKGTFENGRIINGKGYYPNGTVREEGTFKDQILNEGSKFNPDGSLHQRGTFSSGGSLHGKGMDCKGTDCWEGDFHYNQRHGTGKEYKRVGNTFNFKEDSTYYYGQKKNVSSGSDSGRGWGGSSNQGSNGGGGYRQQSGWGSTSGGTGCTTISEAALKGKTAIGQLLAADPKCPQHAWRVLMPFANMDGLRDKGAQKAIRKAVHKFVFAAHPDKISEKDKADYPNWKEAGVALNLMRDTLEHCTVAYNINDCLNNRRVK